MREPQSSAISAPRFNQGSAHLNPYCRIGGTYSLNGMMDYPSIQISKIRCLNGVAYLESQLQD